MLNLRARPTARIVALLLALITAAQAQRIVDPRNQELRNYKTHFRPTVPADLAGWEARRGEIVRQVQAAAGLLPPPAKTPLNTRIVRITQYTGWAVETIVIETFPGFYLSGNLYRPEKATSPVPAVLVPHGHWKRGRVEHLPDYSVPALCINLALQGYVAFAYDMVGYNDTRQMPHSYPTREQMLWSFHPMAVQTWNSIRVVDYLESRPEVDRDRIGVTGASGGGTQSFLLAAADARIRVSAPVNMISAHMQGGDPCEEAPGLHVGTSNVEIAAATAPRPMLMVSSTRDWTRNTPREEFPWIQSIYRLYGAADKVENAHIDAPHNYNRRSREAVYRFFAKHLKGWPGGADPVDTEVQVPPDSVLLVREQTNMRVVESAFELWKRSRPSVADAREVHLREALTAITGVRLPLAVLATASGGRTVLTAPGIAAVVVAQWRPGKGKPLVAIHSDGIGSGARIPDVATAIEQGRPVLLIEPFESGEQRKSKERFDRNFFSYHRSDDALRVQDILVALQFARQHSAEVPELAADPETRPVARIAAAISLSPLPTMRVPLPVVSGARPMTLFIPGFERAGGMDAVEKLLQPAP